MAHSASRLTATGIRLASERNKAPGSSGGLVLMAEWPLGAAYVAGLMRLV